MLNIKQIPNFKNKLLRLDKTHIKELDKIIKKIAMNPKIGSVQKGKFQNIYLYKSKIENKFIMIGYLFTDKDLYLLALKKRNFPD